MILSKHGSGGVSPSWRRPDMIGMDSAALTPSALDKKADREETSLSADGAANSKKRVG